MHVDRMDINGNSHIGLLAYCTDKYCLVGRDVTDNNIKKIEQTLKVPVHKVSIAKTSLIGVFLAGNSSKLLVPSLATKSELKVLDELKIDYAVINTKHTALGNNILCNDEGAIINPEMEERAKKQIEEALQVPVITGKIAGLEIVGATCAFNSDSGLIHRDATDKEIDMVEKMLKVKLDIGTLNFGSPFIKSGVIVNNKGFLVGEQTSGPEIQNADYSFGFLKK